MTQVEAIACLNRLDRAILCEFETPLQPLKHLGQEIGIDGIYIKRDDLNGVGPGGNKVRALEYLLGHAIKNNKDTIIASGQKNSNLCTITAAACCKLGMNCVLVHNDYEPQEYSGNALLNKILGIDQYFIGNVTEEERNVFVKKLSQKYFADGAHPFIIENGATTPVGAIGYANIVLELFRSQEEDHISNIFVPAGNGGIAAGVILGNFILGRPYNVHVVSVENSVDKLQTILQKLLDEMRVILDIQTTLVVNDECTLYGDYIGEGWGIPTKESINILYKLASYEGIFLEKIYTSKTLYGMLDILKKSSIQNKRSCFVHSGGFGSLFAQF